MFIPKKFISKKPYVRQIDSSESVSLQEKKGASTKKKQSNAPMKTRETRRKNKLEKSQLNNPSAKPYERPVVEWQKACSDLATKLLSDEGPMPNWEEIDAVINMVPEPHRTEDLFNAAFVFRAEGTKRDLVKLLIKLEKLDVDQTKFQQKQVDHSLAEKKTVIRNLAKHTGTEQTRKAQLDKFLSPITAHRPTESSSDGRPEGDYANSSSDAGGEIARRRLDGDNANSE